MVCCWLVLDKKVTKKKGKMKANGAVVSCTKLDHSTLASGHHSAFVASLIFLHTLFPHEDSCELQQVRMLLVGLGGGAFPVFINKFLHNVSMFGC